MIVDDEPDIIEAFSMILQSMGHNVVATAGNGFDALFLYSKHKPDVVFLDYDIPGLDGLIVAEKLHAKNPDTRIVVLSGKIDMNDLPLQHSNRFNIFNKPVTKEQLANYFDGFESRC